MDEKYRKDAKSKIANAKYLERKHAAKKIIIDEYKQGINLFLQIINKTPADFHDLSNAYCDLAIFYFNKKEHVKAAQCYLDAIKQLLQTELNDESHRKLTELYIDLADACYESFNQPAGDEAMSNAIKAFGLIKNKTIEEQKIGDPGANLANFKKFHKYYEHKLSTDSYIESSEFTNHELLLGARQVTRQEEQEEQALFAKFETISIGEIQQIDHSIESMLSQLSLSAEKPLFNPVVINETPNDGVCRNMAMQLLTLAKSHIQSQLIPETIATYRQAIKTLQMIKTPQQSDHQIVQHLEEQIKYLQRKKSVPEAPSSFISPSMPIESQRSVSVTQSGRGFFAQSLHEETKEEYSMDVDMDVEMLDETKSNGINM
ncbi:hypothetical protein LEAN103870_10240 [Legionella anisa]|uniref:Tetratricopeptide repeat protein n=1 Tax=Legionella anisa TaxID=28082 RepID=A0AAX0WWJ7_9GAMM|nr:hypothetical protein [Legionella anisa]AWN73657.1 hypothetical protein DLD14_07295 [Legionella anisa]KTC75773.1 hypothetical protein Lani_0596 [Legionella anisa]MBN5935589.1 hypothetical protein [Legionella anisa]MCW8426550.1 hypothetical protein [Legionella anisa]MCW8448213.1 hypothetical protein [Legionella anisa]